MDRMLKEAIKRKRLGKFNKSEDDEGEELLQDGDQEDDDQDDFEDSVFLADTETMDDVGDDFPLTEEDEADESEEENGMTDLAPGRSAEPSEDAIHVEVTGDDVDEKGKAAIIEALTGSMSEDELKRKPRKSLTERMAQNAYAMKKLEKKGKA